MTRVQAVTVSIIFAFVILGLMGVVFLLLFPYQQLLSPTPTTTPTATLALRPTSVRVYLPTPSLETPTPAEPTPTNTRVPTLTPSPPRQPTPTVDIDLPTPFIRATATVAPPPPLPPGSVTPTATLASQRRYEILFYAEDTDISDGDCTDLVWRAAGAVSVWLDDRPVSQSGTQEVCPERDTDYTLKIQVEGNARIEQKKVQIDVD